MTFKLSGASGPPRRDLINPFMANRKIKISEKDYNAAMKKLMY